MGFCPSALRWLAPLSIALLSGCASAWSMYEDSLYQTLVVPGPEAYAEHADLLGRIVEESRQAGETPPPGILAEYGFE